MVLHASGGGVSSHFLRRLSTLLCRVVETKAWNINNQNSSGRGILMESGVSRFSPTKGLMASSAVAQNEDLKNVCKDIALP